MEMLKMSKPRCQQVLVILVKGVLLGGGSQREGLRTGYRGRFRIRTPVSIEDVVIDLTSVHSFR